MKNKRVILISLDALANSDFDELVKLPNFKKLTNSGTFCNNVESIYPSLTFPAHSSIITGCNSNKHGIVNNYVFNPYDLHGKWYHYSEALKVPALWDYFADNNMDVLSLSWPVSAGANIKYSLPEMTPAKPKIWNEQMYKEQVDLWYNYGTKEIADFAINSTKNFSEAWFLGTQPDLDLTMIELLKESLPKYKTDLTLFHIYGMDDAKHNHGVLSQEVKSYYPIYDDLVGWLMDYVDSENQKGENFVLMITGDHSQKDIQQTVYLNHILRDIGACTTDDNKLKDWDVLFHSGDGMAYLYKNNEKESDWKSKVENALDGNPAINKVLQPDEFIPLGCDPTALLVIEAAEGYSISDAFTDEKLTDDSVGAPLDHAVHGYFPFLENYQTMFFSYGHEIKNRRIDAMKIIDIAPTITNLFNIKPTNMDGKPIL